MLFFDLLQKSFVKTIFFLFIFTFSSLPMAIQATDTGIPQPVSRDAFTVSADPIKKMATGLDQGKYELVVDSKTISNSLQGKKGLIDLKIEFASGSAQLAEGAQKQVLEIAEALQSQNLSNEKITITGHTDNIGSAKTNLALSRRRALAVKKALINLGVDGARLNSQGLGESEPIADNQLTVGRARNRRVTLSRQ